MSSLQVEFVDIDMLTASILVLAAVTKVALDILKYQIDPRFMTSHVKYVLSFLIPMILAALTGVTLFDTGNPWLLGAGTILAGLIAGLGSQAVHEVMAALKMLKQIKK